VGYNLGGNYGHYLATPLYATSPEIDASGLSNLSLRFQRWLRLRAGDTATIEVSGDGQAWLPVWATSESVLDTSWNFVEYPIRATIAPGQVLRIRWGLGSDQAQADLGWNIDDVEIVGEIASNEPADFELVTVSNRDDWGTVSGGGVFLNGAVVEVKAIPREFHHFCEWTGDVIGNENPTRICVTNNLYVQATFAETVTVQHSIPFWWLAQFGFRENLEDAVKSIGANGLPVWQSYVAGLDPTDPESRLTLSVARSAEGIVLEWNPAADRVYTLLFAPDLNGRFAPIAGAIDLSGTIRSWSSPAPDIGRAFYRLEVRKP
jgi:hypothetical protein